MWWVIGFLIVVVAGLVAGMLVRPKTPGQVSQTYSVPATELGVPLGILFGKKRLTNLKIAWWGDVRIIKKKLNTTGKK